MPSIRAIILDFDGVMVHTMPLLYRIFSDKEGNILLGDEQEYDSTLCHFLSYCREHSLLIAIGSNSRREYIDHALHKMNIQDYFVTSENIFTVFGQEHIKISKMDPNFWKQCADTLGVSYGQCLVVEDSIAGIIGAKEGGMKSCYYHRFCAPEKECVSLADYHADNFDDIIKLLDTD